MVGGWTVGVWVGHIPQKKHQVAWYFLAEVLKCGSYVTVCIWSCWFSSLVWKVSLCRISISNRPFHRLRMSKVLGPTEVLEALHAKPMAMDLLLGFGFFRPSLILKQSRTWGMGTERISMVEVDRRGLSHQKFKKFFSPKNTAKVKWVKWASRITGSIFRSSTSALALQFFFCFCFASKPWDERNSKIFLKICFLRKSFPRNLQTTHPSLGGKEDSKIWQINTNQTIF